MICPKCKAEMPDSAAYCIKCGAELPRHADMARPGIRGGRAGKAAGAPEGVAQEEFEQRVVSAAQSDRTGSADSAGQSMEAEAAKDAGKDEVIGGFRFSGGINWGKKGAENVRGQAQASGSAWNAPAGYATPMQRFGAFVLDFLIIGALLFFTTFVLAVLYPPLYDRPDSLIVVSNLLPLALTWAYYAGLESSPIQATPGKLMLGIKVTDLQGYRINLSKATGRHFAKIISGLLFLLGYIMIFFTRRNQGLHDILSGCLVVRREEGEQVTGPGVRP